MLPEYVSLRVLREACERVPVVKYAFAVVGIAAAAAIALSFLGSIKTLVVAIPTILVAMVLLLVLSRVAASRDNSTRIAGQLLVWLVVVFVCVLLVLTATALVAGWPHGWATILGLETATKTATVVKIENPPSMATLFETDITLPDGLVQDRPIHFGEPQIHIFCRAFYDYGEHSKFLAYLVPAERTMSSVVRNPREDVTFSVVMSIIEDYGACFAVTDLLKMQVPGLDRIETEPLGEFNFSGKVFIYYESFMDDGQKAEIERESSSRGLSVELRGPEYQMTIFHMMKDGSLPVPKSEYVETENGIVPKPP